jgi:hypothetical protein
MPNRAIEIHDSTIDHISISTEDVVVHFSSVYIHQSAGRPSIDAGTAWVQKARLRIRGAVVAGSFTGRTSELTDGHIKLGGIVFSNTIPVPLNHTGEVELSLISPGETISIKGGSAELELLGEPKYVEEFEPTQQN